jgi:hypothetical protein
MSVELASCPKPAETAVRRRFDWLRLLLVVNVLAILTVAIGLRAWHLGNIPGLNGDEAWSGVQAMRLVGGQPFSCRTPTGNPVNPFYLGPLAALHLFLAPSTAVLRIPALVSGLAALVVNFWLSRRVLGSTVAWVSTLLLAVLPLNIAYSRFAWDASQSVLATTLLLYLALRLVPIGDRPRASLLPPFLAYAAAIWVHPTNVFAGWLLFIPLAHRYRSELRGALERIRASRGTWQGGRFAGLAIGGLGATGLSLTLAMWKFRPPVLPVLARAVDPAQWGLFIRRLIRLFSGSTIFEFIPGPAAENTALDGTDLLFCCVALAASLGLLQVLRDPAATRQRCLALGSLATAISFFLIAGPAAIAPHVERYGACLIAPGVALIAVGLSYWLRPGQRFARSAIATLCILAWLSLGSFGWRYFASIQRTGGDSHLAFRTAAIEPKQAAWDYIARQSGGQPIAVVADSWWLYWPLAYLSAGHPEARVLHSDELTGDLSSKDLRQNLPTAMWLVDFCESPAERPAASRCHALAQIGRTIVVTDYSGRPLVSLVRAQPKLPD